MKEKAVKYIKNLTLEERNNLKIMLVNGIVCGSDFAKSNNIDPYVFTQELKLILLGEENV